MITANGSRPAQSNLREMGSTGVPSGVTAMWRGVDYETGLPNNYLA